MNARILSIILALTVSACASVPLKGRVSAGHQAVRATLVAIDELERGLCKPAPPPNSNTCTNPNAAVVGLTNDKHQEFSRHLVVAFDLDIKAGEAIIAWRAGEPMPRTIPDLIKNSADVVAVASSFSDAAILKQARDYLNYATALVSLFL